MDRNERSEIGRCREGRGGVGWGRKALNGGAKERERDFNERVWQFVADIYWILEVWPLAFIT